MKKITTIQLQAVKVLTPNGFSHGIVTKRSATTREVRHVMKNILGIVINEQDDMYNKEEYEEYNKEITQTFNEWLNGTPMTSQSWIMQAIIPMNRLVYLTHSKWQNIYKRKV